jgi:hypothetical protein
MDRNPSVDWDEIDDVILGCANQAGEDNRNLARMAGLLAGLPHVSGGVTLNRLCGSGMDAVTMAARVIRGSDADMVIAGGSESMSRAPFVMAKATSAFDRNAEIYDTTIGWRFVNPKMKGAYGDDTMPSTAENVAQEWQVSRADQDAFAGSQPGQGGCRAGKWPLRRRDRARVDPAAERRSHRGRPRRTSAQDERRGAGEIEADRARRRHGHCGQCVRCQ